jgi:hypothetical protein
MTLTMFWIFWLHSRMVSFNAFHSRACCALLSQEVNSEK